MDIGIVLQNIEFLLDVREYVEWFLQCSGVVIIMLLFSLDDWQFRWNYFGRKMLKTEPVVCKTIYLCWP